MKTRYFIRLCIVMLGIPGFVPISEAQDTNAKLTFSGTNYFETRYGKKEKLFENLDNEDFFKDGEFRIQPWYYIKEFIDMNIGLNKFYFRGRFQVDEPTMGYHPEDVQWYREFVARRTFGFNSEILNVEAGHFKTEFGRGMTISLKDDPTVELSNVLDGVSLSSELPFGTIKGFAGRNINDKLMGFFEDPDNMSDVNSLVENFQFRDNIFGAHLEAFPFSYISFLSLLSASSLGGGVINYRRQVSKLDTISHIDTVNNDTTLSFTQPRTNVYLPSWLINVSLGDINFYGEYARGYASEYGFVDSLNKEDIISQKKSFALYLETSAAVGDFYVRGEYINYFYNYIKDEGLGNVITSGILARYTDAPWARFKQVWHLLDKRTFIPHIEDALGYNIEVTWKPSDRTQLLLTSNFGGKHVPMENDSAKYSFFKFKTGETFSYYEIYGELTRSIGEKIDLKIGVDYGQMDPKTPDVLLRTFAARAEFGPFNGKHVFSIDAEAQANTFSSYVEEDYADVKAVVLENIPLNQINPNDLNSSDLTRLGKYYKAVNKEAKNRHEELGYNGLGEISYRYSSMFKVSCLLEYESLIGDAGNDIFIIDEIQFKSRLFFSGGFSVTPAPNHTFLFEGGSFSRKKICNMGTCTVIPAFKGFKFTIVSVI